MADSIDGSSLTGARLRLQREEYNLDKKINDTLREKAKAEAKGKRDISHINDRTRRAARRANDAGNKEIQLVKDLNLKNIENLNKFNASKLQMLADKTRTDFENSQVNSIKQVHDLQRANMEKFLETSTKAEDPFYRPKQFTTDIQEEEDHYKIKIALPSHEARNVGVSGFSNQLKLSFSRSYQAQTPISSSQENSTSAHESVTETYYLPTNLNFKKVVREFRDGALFLKIAKANPLQFNPGDS